MHDPLQRPLSWPAFTQYTRLYLQVYRSTRRSLDDSYLKKLQAELEAAKVRGRWLRDGEEDAQPAALIAPPPASRPVAPHSVSSI
jgi:hypothetical protein